MPQLCKCLLLHVKCKNTPPSILLLLDRNKEDHSEKIKSMNSTLDIAI
jgi:hypothetical protein